MLNKSYVAGYLHSGPRSTNLSTDGTFVMYFEIMYFSDGVKRDSNVKKSIISCIAYGDKAEKFYGELISYKSISNGGEYEGENPYIFVEGSLKHRKIRLGEEKQRIMELNVENMVIITNESQTCLKP
jgi:hypothetical protein